MEGQQSQEKIAQAYEQGRRALTELEVRNIARVCHEANRAYCATLGDTSQPAWQDAPAWQTESAIDGVKKAAESGGLLGDSSAERSHNNWMEQKLRAGWRWGPVKDPEKKEHPCLLPYSALPDEEKRKDVLFLTVVFTLDPRR